MCTRIRVGSRVLLEERKRFKMDRLSTDFLCSSSSFLAGIGSVLNIAGQTVDYNTSEDPDKIAMTNDWRMIGQDFADVMEEKPAKK